MTDTATTQAKPPLDGREPDHTRTGLFVYHDCWRCGDGKRPCAQGAPTRCDYPRARND